MKILRNFVVFSAIVAFAYGAFPTAIKQCKVGDVECIKDTINFIFEKKNEGEKGLHLVKLNPLHIKTIEINQGGESPVNIELKFQESDLFGISNIKVEKVKGFGEDMTEKHIIEMRGEFVSLIGKYDIKGRVLLLPLYGSGDSNITLANPLIRLTFTGKPEEKDGKQYMKLENFKLDAKISRMYIQLNDLFNGDKALSDNTNLFLNENWQEIFGELRGSIFSAFGKVFEQVIQNVFSKYPYEDVFEH